MAMVAMVAMVAALAVAILAAVAIAAVAIAAVAIAAVALVAPSVHMIISRNWQKPFLKMLTSIACAEKELVLKFSLKHVQMMLPSKLAMHHTMS